MTPRLCGREPDITFPIEELLMIPEIGVMVGLYIMTRMVELVLTKRNLGERIVLTIFAVVTIGIAALVVVDMTMRGTTNVSLSDLK
jgi:hypothetical protein